MIATKIKNSAAEMMGIVAEIEMDAAFEIGATEIAGTTEIPPPWKPPRCILRPIEPLNWRALIRVE